MQLSAQVLGHFWYMFNTLKTGDITLNHVAFCHPDYLLNRVLNYQNYVSAFGKI